MEQAAHRLADFTGERPRTGATKTTSMIGLILAGASGFSVAMGFVMLFRFIAAGPIPMRMGERSHQTVK